LLKRKENPDKDCWLDLENFKSYKIGLENIRLIVNYPEKYDPYQANEETTKKEFYQNDMNWFMEDDKKLDFYQHKS